MASLQVLLLGLSLVLVHTGVQGKVFERCELARDLRNKYGVGMASLGHWVCMAFAESSYRTTALHKNKNKSIDYGIFQINNRYWCEDGKGGDNDCNVHCSQLRTPDIEASVKCAKIILRRHGFKAWYGWRDKCKGKNVGTYIEGCF